MEDIAIQYLGEVEGVCLDFDMASRFKLMRAIDQARREGQVKHSRLFHKDSIFKMNESSFKILTDDSNQDVLLRLPLQQVSHISYVYEDQQHIVAIKYGEVQQRKSMLLEAEEELMCHLAVMLCANKAAADRLCSRAECIFEDSLKKHKQQVFQEPIFPAAEQMDHSSSDILHSNYSFLSSSCSDLNSTKEENLQQQQQQQQPDVVSKEPASASLSNNQKQLIKEYMEKLYNVLDSSQLESFADLVRAWQADLPLPQFLSKLINLYGPRHHHLIAEMRPFIPAKDLDTYEAFLHQLDNS